MPNPTSIKLLAVLGGALWLTGCAFAPGSHFDSSVEGAPIDDLVEIEPITPGLVSALQPAQGMETGNAELQRLAAQQGAAIDDYDYRIGRGDVLSIIVYDHPELTIPAGSERSPAESGNIVHRDGTIFYPYIGRVQVEGRSVAEVRDLIASRLQTYISEPQVEVRIAAFKSQEVQVTGEVRRPGAQPITNVPLTLLDAIGQAGGLDEEANWHEVQFTRAGKTQRISLYAMLNEGQLARDILLQDGDVIHVPDVGNQQVYVMGEVGEPQALSMGRTRLTLTDALAQAGSFKEASANASGIFVFRRTPATSGKLATVYQLDARNAAAMVLGTRFVLQPTDIVYVTSTPLGRWNRVINQLLPTVTAVYQVTRAANDANELRDEL